MKLTKRDIRDGISLVAVLIGVVALSVVLIGDAPVDSGWGHAVIIGVNFAAMAALYYLIIRERKPSNRSK